MNNVKTGDIVRVGGETMRLARMSLMQPLQVRAANYVRWIVYLELPDGTFSGSALRDIPTSIWPPVTSTNQIAAGESYTPHWDYGA